jgi:hypothetical protein
MGNRAVASAFGTSDGLAGTVAAVFGAGELELAGSVGREGMNQPVDVLRIRTRLLGLGYDVGEGLDGLAAAIALYQGEVVGLKHPDGRVDPGGRTVAALAKMRRKEAPAKPSEPAEAPKGTADAPKETNGAPERTPEVPMESPAAPAPQVGSGARIALQDPKLERLVAAAHSPAVEAVAADLAGLEKTFKSMKRSKYKEELGVERDKLVELIGDLRAKIARLDTGGLEAAAAAELKARFHRALNAVTPFYYQHENIILEYSTAHHEKKDIFNTCNITSLSMALEALGKDTKDYKHKELIPPIGEYFANDIANKADAAAKVADKGLLGLRLPDYIAMAAIARAMGYEQGTTKDIEAAGNVAFGSDTKQRKLAIQHVDTLTALADDFGVQARYGAFKLDPGAKRDTGSQDLDDFAEKQFEGTKAGAALSALQAKLAKEKDPERQAALEKQLATLTKKVDAAKTADAEIEGKVPLERYKRQVLAQLGPELDRGRQVIVGQYHHYVRLESIDENGVVKDDPGGWNRGNWRITWEQARAMGLFRIWLSLG